jgi:hypothetical protein
MKKLSILLFVALLQSGVVQSAQAASFCQLVKAGALAMLMISGGVNSQQLAGNNHAVALNGAVSDQNVERNVEPFLAGNQSAIAISNEGRGQCKLTGKLKNVSDRPAARKLKQTSDCQTKLANCQTKNNQYSGNMDTIFQTCAVDHTTCQTYPGYYYNCDPYDCDCTECPYDCDPYDCDCDDDGDCDTCWDTCYEECCDTCYDSCYQPPVTTCHTPSIDNNLAAAIKVRGEAMAARNALCTRENKMNASEATGETRQLILNNQGTCANNVPPALPAANSAPSAFGNYIQKTKAWVGALAIGVGYIMLDQLANY